jgi:signal recognition particle subunit SRP54
VDVYAEDGNSNPVQVAKNALEKAKKELYDVLIIDSAGRLAIDNALMEELKNVKNAINPFETFYVADSMSGQDAVKTATSFNEQIGVSGVIFSKFDGDSKGGVALGVAKIVGVPLRFIGLGEKPADLEVFIPNRITSRLMGLGDVESLAEKMSTVIDEKKAKDLTQKIKKGQFNFNDFLAQTEEMKKLGSIKNLMGMMPGLSGMASQIKDIDLENSGEIKRVRAIISSMTKKERENPDLLNNSRKRRIANGAGIDQIEVNRFIKQFEQAAKFAKKFSSKSGMKDLMAMIGQQQKGGFAR